AVGQAATVAAPTFSPSGGTYTAAQTVTLSSATSGATIRYTTDGSAPIQTAAPTFSPSGGTYTTAQTVTLSSTTSGATIRYTLYGSAPSETAGTVYTAPFAVSGTTTVKAVAYASGLTDSSVATAIYTILTAAPTF